MKLTQPLRNLSAKDGTFAGGKGAALGALIGAGFPVPAGFVITTAAFGQFTRSAAIDIEIDAALDSVDRNKMHTVERASEKIETLILSTPIPAAVSKAIMKSFVELGARFVAVRSSATMEDGKMAAWAGQLQTYLNTNERSLLVNVQKCWASLFSPRAILYGLEKGKPGQTASMAVLVQQMVESDVAGVAFSVHPVTQDSEQILIEAGIGLGEAVVSGTITPDNYTVRKGTARIASRHIFKQEKGLFRMSKGGNEWKKLPATRGKKQKLLDTDIALLAKMVTDIERHFGFPVDVEWAKAGKDLFILQSRPITTLQPARKGRNARSAVAISGSDYKILFRLKGRLTCLHAELFVRGSLGLGDPVVVFKKGDWHTFMRRDKEQLCLQRGLEIFSGKKTYKEYADGFRSYIAMARKKVVPAFEKPVCPTRQELEELLPVLQRQMYFYGITEFSYHDLAYERYLETGDPVLGKNLDDLGKLKFEGRAMLNEYIFEKGVFHNLLQGISRKFLRREDDGEFLFMSELLGLYSGVQVPEKVIRERRQVYGCAAASGEMTVFSREEALLAWDELHSGKKSDVITGITANGGSAAGRVVIAPMLVSPGAISRVAAKMKKGDILVAESTTPELMGLCSKAAAIVTDQGGMLSHAAIVSRELNIPCIIGAGIATEVLHDGDKVEVDATAGKVKIISRRKQQMKKARK